MNWETAAASCWGTNLACLPRRCLTAEKTDTAPAMLVVLLHLNEKKLGAQMPAHPALSAAWILFAAHFLTLALSCDALQQEFAA